MAQVLCGELIKIGTHREAVVKIQERAGGCVHSGGDGGERVVSGLSIRSRRRRTGRAVGRMGMEGQKSIKDDAQLFTGRSEWVMAAEFARQSGVFTRFK